MCQHSPEFDSRYCQKCRRAAERRAAKRRGEAPAPDEYEWRECSYSKCHELFYVKKKSVKMFHTYNCQRRSYDELHLSTPRVYESMRRRNRQASWAERAKFIYEKYGVRNRVVTPYVRKDE